MSAHMASLPTLPALPALKAAPIDAAGVIRGVLAILGRWGLSGPQSRVLLGSPPASTFSAWKAGRIGAVPQDTIRRAGYIAGIYKALRLLYSDKAQGDDWLRRANRAFAERPPLERMLAGDVTDLAAVHAYLNAARAPWS